jgi:Fe-S-cluster containining protein
MPRRTTPKTPAAVATPVPKPETRNPEPTIPKPVWFSKGLQFTCTQCGNCCTGEPGFIFLDEAEADAIAERLGMDPVAFRRRYTATVHHEHGATLSLREQGDGACVFWRAGAGCTIYEQRPTQCRTWPFWRRVVASKAAWRREASQCPGMDRGTLHPAADIQAIAARDGLPG